MKLFNSRLTNIVILLVVLLTVAELAALLICRPDMHGLSGTYYNNPDWQGEPALKSVDAEFSANLLKAQRAKLPQNIYSVLWTGYLDIPETGVYTFFTASDDGSWLFIDDILVVDNGGAHGLQEKQGKLHLLKGLHNIRLKYFQTGGFAAIQFLWQKDQSLKSPVPAAFLLPAHTGTAGVWLYQTGKTLLLPLLALWFVILASLAFAVFTRPTLGFYARWARIGLTVRRLLIEPILFAGRQLKHPETWSWLAVVSYTAIIFLTLSYIRTVTNYLMQQFGEDILARVTVVTLIGIGGGVLIYLLSTRRRRLVRLLYFAGVIALYSYMISAEFRSFVHGWTQHLGYTGAFLQAQDIFPVYPGEKVHLLEYGFLGVLFCNALRYRIKDKTGYLLALLGVYLIGLMDENIQWTLPNRVGEYRDALVNLISGALGLLAIGLVIRPPIFRQRCQRSALRPLCYVLAGALLYTGLFLQTVQQFGATIFMPDNGSQFVSAFPESRLLALDKILLQRLEGKPAEDAPRAARIVFGYEAQRHQAWRDWHYQNKQFFESYCEQEILKTYFRAHLRRYALELFDYQPEQFKTPPDLNVSVFYASTAQEKAITLFSQKAMWAALAITAALLCFAATFFPGAPDRLAVPKSLQRRVERLLLRPLFGLLAALAILFTLYAATIKPKAKHVNLLFLTIDSCQPKYFGAYGYARNTTPFFDKLASEGVLFSNAIASSSWTIPSIVSLLTGVNPNVHGIDMRGKSMDPQVPTIFEALAQQGYAIGDTSYMLTEPSVNSVFKKAEISPESALAEGRSEESYLLSWLETHKEQPFFAWTHFHTVHLPYNAAPPYNKLFLEGIDPAVFNDEQIKFVRSQLIIRKGEVEFDQARHAPVVRALSTQAIRQQDAKIGKVLLKLAELGLRDNTIVVITADHGEELLEHGFVGHASTSWDGTVYDDLIKVPLLIYYPPQLAPGQRIAAQVRTIDVLPTVLDLLQMPFAGKLQGQSLLPVIQGKAALPETAFAETTPCGYSCPSRLAENRLWAVRTNEWKLIAKYDAATKATRAELYDLQADPGETKDVLPQHSDVAEKFQQELQRWMDAPAQFPYQPKKSDAKHYLDVDVEVRPIVLYPKVGMVMTPQTDQQRVHLQWIGDKKTEYVIEYDVGAGGYRMTGQLEVVGPEQWYGPYPDDIWQELPKYNPWKFRIIPKQYPQYPSDWITFEMKAK